MDSEEENNSEQAEGILQVSEGFNEIVSEPYETTSKKEKKQQEKEEKQQEKQEKEDLRVSKEELANWVNKRNKIRAAVPEPVTKKVVKSKPKRELEACEDPYVDNPVEEPVIKKEEEDVPQDRHKIALEEYVKEKPEPVTIVTEEELEKEKAQEDNTDNREIVTAIWNKEENKERLDKKMRENKNPDVIVTEKAAYLFREIPLYKIEPIVLAITIVSGIFIGVLVFLGVLDSMFSLLSFGLLAVISGGIWLFKFINYKPNKNKRIVLKIFNSGGVALCCEKIKDNKIQFNRNTEPSVITNLRAHTDVYSGHPFIIAIEDHFENIDVLKTVKGKISSRTSGKVMAALDEAHQQGVRSERMKNMMLGKQLDNSWLLIGIIIVILLLGYYIWFMAAPMIDSIAALGESISVLSSNVSGFTATSVIASTGVDVTQGSG